MSDPATPVADPATPPSAADLILQNLADSLGLDAITDLKTTLGNTAKNIQSNPSVTNAAVQGAALLPAFIAVGPTLESDAIQKAAGALGQLIDLIPTPTVPAAPAA